MTKAKVILDSCIWAALQHGQISLQVLEKYVGELEHCAIITVEKDRVRIRVAEF